MYLKIPVRDNARQANLERRDENTPPSLPKVFGTEIRILEKMGQREVLSKSVRFMSEDFARQNNSTDASMYLGDVRGNVDDYVFKETRRTGFRSRFRSVHAHDELLKEYWSEESWTVRRFRTPNGCVDF